MLIVIDTTVTTKCRKEKSLFLYIRLDLNVIIYSISCPCTFIFFLNSVMLFVDVTVYSIGSMDTTEQPDIHVIPVDAVIKTSHFVGCDTADTMIFAHSGAQHILCCVFALFSSSCVPYIALFPALSIIDYPLGTDPASFKLTYISYRWRFSFVSFAYIVSFV